MCIISIVERRYVENLSGKNL